MKEVRSYIAILCALLVAAPSGFAQDGSGAPQSRTPDIGNEAHWYSGITAPYRPGYIAPVSVSNSSRLDRLISAGNLYLSLQDAIALALENNINIEVQRYGFEINEVALKGAQAGQGGAFDPVLTSNLNWAHNTQTSSNSLSTGRTSNVNTNKTYNFGISQNFASGAQTTLGFNNSTGITDGVSSFNPTYNSSLRLQVTQPLLNGFGFAFNRRGITIAKNNLRLTDYQFQQQVNTTLNTVVQSYWNLVSARLNVDVVQQSLDLAQTLFQNNQRQVEVGTLAPIEVVNAQAQVETNRTNLINAQTTVLQNETTLKNLLSRNGIASAALATVSIIPTDRVTVPDVEQVQPIQDLMEAALLNRPELTQQQIQMDNSEINLKAAENSLLPSVAITSTMQNSGLAGNGQLAFDPLTGQFRGPNPYFIGGFGNAIGQVLRRNFPTYSIGFNISIPLRNRTAQAQMAQQDLQLRQAQLNYQAQINQIRVDVQNAQIAVDQARSRHQTAEFTVALQEQLLDAEQKKYSLGASTVYQVILYQRDLANARQQVIAAQVAYAQAKLQMDVATGSILQKYGVTFDEAKEGNVQRAPDSIPVNLENPGQANAAPAANPATLSPLQRALLPR